MSDQEFETQFEEAFEPAEVDVEDSPPSPESLEEPQEAPETFEFQGREFTRDQLDPVLKFATWANENPERWEKLQRWESGEIDFSERQHQIDAGYIPPAEPAVPEFEEVDPFDEEYLRGLGREIHELKSRDSKQREAEGRAAVDAGISAFSQAHPDLTEQDMNRVLSWVHNNETLTTIRPDLPYEERRAAVVQKFEDAYKVNFFDRVQAEQTRRVVEDMNQRRRAAASSGSPVSAPRTRPAPTNDAERRQAYVDDIAQALNEAT